MLVGLVSSCLTFSVVFTIAYAYELLTHAEIELMLALRKS